MESTIITSESQLEVIINRVLENNLERLLERQKQKNWKRAKELVEIFGESIATVNRNIGQMKKDAYFKQFIDKQSGKFQVINLEGYKEYRKSKKESYKKSL
ncbi:hypothetical protein [Lactococcus lactis]|uniref:hypothetical protein n=1 Tax=Lactococcus lactis TaxID=1358 RepID=UPI001912E3EA|nr:hypothetical protein [Lactococcus lactis]WDA68451.1 hypothetical protein IL310_13125 [Lactococcus lactis]